jgi:stage II sporulation protein R
MLIISLSTYFRRFLLIMKLKIWEVSLLTAVCITVLCGFVMGESQQELSGQLVRLHVVANSDSDEDQAVKLQVRDAVLELMEPELQSAGGEDEAEAIISERLDDICRIAEDVSGEGVSVTLCQENFPTRDYGTFSLPAGDYTTLCIEIGEAAGHNWWCVVFPPLCMGTGDAAAIGLNGDDAALITGAKGYVVKFKLMELLGRLRSCN